MSSHGIQSLDSALREAGQVGLLITRARGNGSGELLIQLPSGRKLRLNSRRKDAPRCLLKEIQRARTATAPGEQTQ